MGETDHDVDDDVDYESSGTVKRSMKTRWHRNGSALEIGVGIGIAVGVGLDPHADGDPEEDQQEGVV